LLSLPHLLYVLISIPRSRSSRPMRAVVSRPRHVFGLLVVVVGSIPRLGSTSELVVFGLV